MECLTNQAHSVVAAWEVGGLTQETMRYLFRRGEVLSEGRTHEEEVKLTAVSSLMNIPHDGGR